MNSIAKRLSHKVLEIKTTYKPKNPVSVLCVADVHFDNKNCKIRLLKKHMDEALDNDRLMFFCGDTFCLMQGPGDPRRSSADRHDQDNSDAYVNSVLSRAWDFFGPYAHNIAGMSYGNHETTYIKKTGIDVLELFIDGLNDKCGSNVQRMPFEGWIHHSLESKHKGRASCFKTYFHHGAGGGGPVTKGVIKTNRRNAIVDGADFLISGHIHESFIIETPKIYTTRRGNELTRNVLHVQLPTYKDEHIKEEEYFNYHTISERSPRPLGGWWLNIEASFSGGNTDFKHSATRAQ